jgi:hypothetical protein
MKPVQKFGFLHLVTPKAFQGSGNRLLAKNVFWKSACSADDFHFVSLLLLISAI